MAYDSTKNPIGQRSFVPVVDGSRRIPDVLKTALQDPAVPYEVKAIVVELAQIDPVDASLEARIFARALTGSHREVVGVFGGGMFMRRTLKAWEQDFEPDRKEASAALLVAIVNAWDDAALASVL